MVTVWSAPSANRADGTVFIDVQGAIEAVEAFLRDVSGPRGVSHAHAVQHVAELPVSPTLSVSTFCETESATGEGREGGGREGAGATRDTLERLAESREVLLSFHYHGGASEGRGSGARSRGFPSLTSAVVWKSLCAPERSRTAATVDLGSCPAGSHDRHPSRRSRRAPVLSEPGRSRTG